MADTPPNFIKIPPELASLIPPEMHWRTAGELKLWFISQGREIGKNLTEIAARFAFEKNAANAALTALEPFHCTKGELSALVALRDALANEHERLTTQARKLEAIYDATSNTEMRLAIERYRADSSVSLSALQEFLGLSVIDTSLSWLNGPDNAAIADDLRDAALIKSIQRRHGIALAVKPEIRARSGGRRKVAGYERAFARIYITEECKPVEAFELYLSEEKFQPKNEDERAQAWEAFNAAMKRRRQAAK